MKAKDFLNQAYLLDQQIKSKSEQIQSLNELATSCTATMTGMPHNPNRGTSRMADAVCKIIDLQNEIASDMDRLVQIKKDIVDVIGRVEDTDEGISATNTKRRDGFNRMVQDALDGKIEIKTAELIQFDFSGAA